VQQKSQSSGYSSSLLPILLAKLIGKTGSVDEAEPEKL